MGTLATVDDETESFARLQLMDDVDVIIPARLRLDGVFGSDSIRIPPATRADDVMIEGSTVTIVCSLEVAVAVGVSDVEIRLSERTITVDTDDGVMLVDKFLNIILLLYLRTRRISLDMGLLLRSVLMYGSIAGAGGAGTTIVGATVGAVVVFFLRLLLPLRTLMPVICLDMN